MGGPKYMWMQGSRWLDAGMGYHAALIIYNTANGISGVEILDQGAWCVPNPFFPSRVTSLSAFCLSLSQSMS
jgi:hypothetical protein